MCVNECTVCGLVQLHSDACVHISVDVAEVDVAPVSQLCTACRQKLDASKPDSVFQHSLLNVLLCKVCVVVVVVSMSVSVSYK